MGCDIVEEERALPLLGAALTERQKLAEPAVSRPIGRIGEQAWRICDPGGRRRRAMPASLAALWAR
jgi:hypothetical protein